MIESLLQEAMSKTLGRPVAVERCVMRMAYRVGVLVKVRGTGPVRWVLEVRDSFLAGLDVRDLANWGGTLRQQVDQFAVRLAAKARSHRLRTERAARRRRRGW